jgi:hypothetical protein
MSNEEGKEKNPPVTIDGFDDDEDGVEGEDERHSGRVIQGEKLSFSNDFVWLTADDEEVPATRELCVVDTQRVVQKWVDKTAVDTIFVPPGQKWPNLKTLNDACPTEWRKDFNGNMVGPWQRARVVYFIDLNTMEKFTWPTSTVGGDICVREFRDKVAMMRKLRGARVFAVVNLSDHHMTTRFGDRQRPDLKIVRWVALGPDGAALPAPATPTPPTPSLPPAADAKKAPAESTKTAEPSNKAQPAAPTPPSGITPVEPPSLSEHMGGDVVPW